MQKDIYIIGDIHGQITQLIDTIERTQLEKCFLICVGDLGVGFINKIQNDVIFTNLNKFLRSRKITFLSIRGNHDDPDYFDGNFKYSNVKLLKDYTTMKINDEKFLFVGGAVSVDRTYRQEGVSYWSDEVFILDDSKVKECDVLITHSAPMWIGPHTKKGINHLCERDEFLWDDILEERDMIEKLINLSKPKNH